MVALGGPIVIALLLIVTTGNQAGAGVSALVTDLVGALPPALHTMLNIGGVKVADGLVKIVADEAARRPVPTPAGGD